MILGLHLDGITDLSGKSEPIERLCKSETIVLLIMSDNDGKTSLNASTTVYVCDSSGELQVSRLPPIDMEEGTALADLAKVSGATLRVQYALTDGPFGLIAYYHDFVDGQVVSTSNGLADHANVKIGVTYVNYLRLRLGDIGVVEALEGGVLEGDHAYVSALAGLLESDGYKRAWAINTETVKRLAEVAHLFPLRLPRE